jgi:hypothetical protein
MVIIGSERHKKSFRISILTDPEASHPQGLCGHRPTRESNLFLPASEGTATTDKITFTPSGVYTEARYCRAHQKAGFVPQDVINV